MTAGVPPNPCLGRDEGDARDAVARRATASQSAAFFSGHLHLTAARRDDGQTTIAEQSFRAPFHIGKPYWDGHVLQVQVVNPTAGILAGDRLELEVRIESGAALLVTTPAATRAFMMRSGGAECRQVFTVAAGAWLEYAPEPLCPHRGCDYMQTTRIDVADGGELYYVDALAPGRVGRGERWAWTRLHIALEVRLGGDRLLVERLNAASEWLARSASFHDTADAWIATMVVVSARLTPDDPVWNHIRALHGNGRSVGASRLRRGGWIIRALAPGGQELRDVLREVRGLLAERLPALRSDARKL